ncbi:hypothetical protein Scep_014136 [Stephania cephalantha]|uniref:Uncharacterized protein n=1 Tax=Stephania cephalantha TaxID=152367 RepID=A0AAP0P1D4_9MAGN
MCESTNVDDAMERMFVFGSILKELINTKQGRHGVVLVKSLHEQVNHLLHSCLVNATFAAPSFAASGFLITLVHFKGLFRFMWAVVVVYGGGKVMREIQRF